MRDSSIVTIIVIAVVIAGKGDNSTTTQDSSTGEHRTGPDMSGKGGGGEREMGMQVWYGMCSANAGRNVDGLDWGVGEWDGIAESYSSGRQDRQTDRQNRW
jgi:hypothetical protein